MHQIVDRRVGGDKHFDFALFDSSEWRDRLETQIMPMVHDHLRLDRLEGKRIVDLACGYGFWGKQLLPYKPLMIYIDGRQSHLDRLKQEQPNAATHCMNLEDAELEFHADIVLCMGILYHVGDPRALLRKIAQTTGVIFVDTTVCDNDKEVIYYVNENTQAHGYSVTGNACRPSPRWVENTLNEVGFTHVFDISDARGNVPASPGMSGFLYDWTYERTCGWRRNEQTLRKMYLGTKQWPHQLLK